MNAARADIAADLRLAARVAEKLAALRLRVSRIAELALNQSPSATAQALLGALRDAEF